MANTEESMKPQISAEEIRDLVIEWSQMGCETLVREGATRQIPPEEGVSRSRRRVHVLIEYQAAEKS